MQKLNLPSYAFKLKSNENKTLIFDNLRKKHVVLTPEEWVRQHFVQFLIEEKNYPVSLIAIEKQLTINNLKKRTDIVLFSSDGTPNIIVECKAPNIKINQATFDQIARYNLKLNAKYLIVTNGLQHFFCMLDKEKETYVFLQDIPSYKSE
ncbi:type I restriction enzyme HsdR N-terminal domain-containing protein [Tenacibaculum sp. S7007]|uniref:Type I restriction enzyme HsdR N-terminal domain-containing protein n=1 Tax=Tenacibaculum pelagium TaxID=2759527 RepID=A0A839ANB2_9FLAO|nr:type I restriction enzyme HsdR N-terminal domain-containing protein [Tenacibaculum pelagium]MBA6156573.1 type I restriction enzyme HsdR N-terminal domain-containing protein [Tenacibaculum pelagium]